MKRGDLWWAELPPPIGPRPVLLLARDEAYLVRQLVLVAPTSTRSRDIPAEVEVSPGEGVSKRSWVNCDSLMTIPRWRLRRFLGAITPETRARVDAALRFALGLS